jgi:hypothetical protein
MTASVEIIADGLLGELGRRSVRVQKWKSGPDLSIFPSAKCGHIMPKPRIDSRQI